MTRLAMLVLLFLPGVACADALPLTRGYYVDESAGCGDASNATLALLHKDGINSARSVCAFTSMTDQGDGVFAYTERCTDISSDDPWEGDGKLEVLAGDRFRLFGDDWEVTFRHCPQDSLPEPWRDNDISDLLD